MICPAHSALHLAVEAARSDSHARRFDKLVNGVLRGVQREKADLPRCRQRCCFPKWAGRGAGRRTMALGVEAFAGSAFGHAPLDMTLKVPRRCAVSGAGGATTVLGNTRADRNPRRGGEPSCRVMMPAPMVGAGCGSGHSGAAGAGCARPARARYLRRPGGKTAQLIAMGAKVIALDLDADRMGRLKDNLARLGMDAELRRCRCAANMSPDPVRCGAARCAMLGHRHLPASPRSALAARCAGGLRTRKTAARLIGRAAGMLRPGGTLIYCVCSLQREEGEDQLAYVAKAHPELALVPLPQTNWGAGRPLAREWSVRLHPGLAVPGAAQGTLDGFFIARLREA